MYGCGKIDYYNNKPNIVTYLFSNNIRIKQNNQSKNIRKIRKIPQIPQMTKYKKLN